MIQPGINRETLADQAYAQLRKMILYHELPPGTCIQEKMLAKELKVSVTPVREALNRLERDGLVKKTPWVGTVVTTFTNDEIESLYEIRILLETIAFRQAIPNLSAQDLTKLDALQEKMGNFAEGEVNIAEVDKLNKAFHDFFLIKAKNYWLQQTLNSLHDVLFMLRFPVTNVGRGAKAHTEHIMIIKSLKNNEPEKAVHYLKEHLKRVQKDVMDYYRDKSLSD